MWYEFFLPNNISCTIRGSFRELLLSLVTTQDGLHWADACVRTCCTSSESTGEFRFYCYKTQQSAKVPGTGFPQLEGSTLFEYCTFCKSNSQKAAVCTRRSRSPWNGCQPSNTLLFFLFWTFLQSHPRSGFSTKAGLRQKEKASSHRGEKHKVSETLCSLHHVKMHAGCST